jgi:ureidoglycolate dehydrogenase (NAD+)
MKSQVYLESNRVQKIIVSALRKADVCEESSYHVAASLVQSSSRGIDSHGIGLFPHYYKAVEAGRINKKPAMKVRKIAQSIATVDADHGFGHHAGAVGMDKAIEIAHDNGVGAVSVRNSTHFGAAAYFGLRAAESDCLGFAFTNADGLVKVFNSKERFLGTNPICFTAPLKKEGPFCLDMATSLVSWNRIKLYRQMNKKIPPDWAFDKNGRRVTDPHKAFSLSPIGEYKGFGLGVMVDILCALLARGPISKDILPMFDTPLSRRRHISHFFMAINIKSFSDVAAFKNDFQKMIDRIRRLTPMSKSAKVMVAGDPEKLAFLQRSKTGIPVSRKKFLELLSVSSDFQGAKIL